MVDLSWNTRGRISRKDYRKEVRRHFLFCLIPIGLYLLSGIATTMTAALGPSAWLVSGGLVAIGSVLLAYYRYRFVQIAVKRLHDRSLSGLMLLVTPFLLILLLVSFGVAISAMAAGNVSAQVMNWFNASNTQIATWVPIGIFMAYGFFLRYQMNKEGVPGPNRYGPPTGTAQAQIF